LSYLGNTRVGPKTNSGAGTITCNYDGFGKHPTTIGKGVFIGSDSTLVAPVRIGDGAYIAAGSTITENVPADGLGIARGRQVNKPRWASRKRRELAAVEHSGKKARPRRKSKARPKKSRRR
jgi:bifunctional UDP-N-acetylglucosamine pyrophosphorylase/glucosamine-1-phosphate N-acetyltransferase